jgi:hypothetical protein
MKRISILYDKKGREDWPNIKKAIFQALVENYEYGIAEITKKDGWKRVNILFFKREEPRNKILGIREEGIPFDVYQAISDPTLIFKKPKNPNPKYYEVQEEKTKVGKSHELKT